MISKFRDRLTVSLLKTNIRIIEFECKCNNQTKSQFIDSLITNYANDDIFKRIIEINIIKKLVDLGFICTRLLDMKIDHDKIMIKTNAYYDNNTVSIEAEATFNFNITILKPIKRAEIYALEN